MQTRERLAQEQRDAALVNRLVPPTPLPARDSELLLPEATAQDRTWDDDPDDIFRSAVSEIETQPLLPQSQETPWSVVIVMLAFLVSFVGGTIIALITYPTVTITVVPVMKRVTLTTPLSLATRALTPVTLTKSLTTDTTGKGHQDARSASGMLTFYNGQATVQTIPIGTVFTGADGIKVAIDQAVVIPPGTPPTYGQASVTAHALVPGSTGNIAVGDINTTVVLAVFVKNSAFTGGQNQRGYRAVARRDQDYVSAQLRTMLAQELPQAFPLASGEQVFPTHCTFKIAPNHQVGTEASALTVTATETCTGIAYNSEQLSQRATALFTQQTAPGAQYQLLGEVQVQIVSAMPLTVSCRGLWVFTLSQDYEQFLAEQVAGHTPTQARKYLLQTGWLTRATVPEPLPPDPAHIHFQVLIGI
jgi:hypothetical protein